MDKDVIAWAMTCTVIAILIASAIIYGIKLNMAWEKMYVDAGYQRSSIVGQAFPQWQKIK